MDQDNAATVPNAPAVPIPQQNIVPPPSALGAVNPQNNQAPPPRIDRAPRRSGLVNSNATISGLPPIYLLAANSPFSTIERTALNTFVPSFVHAATIIGNMDYIMSFTHRFLQGAPAWLPPMSLLYFGILFVIQSLRAMRETGHLFGELLWLLEGFELVHDLRSLSVPGPLIPVFQALASHSGPHAWLGDVTPFIPDATILDCTSANGYLLGYVHSLHRVLPDIIGYMDTLQQVTVQNADYTYAGIKVFHNTILGIRASATHVTRLHMCSPGASNPVTHSLQQINTARNNLGFLSFPPPLDATTATTTGLSMSQLLRFYDLNGNYYNWFPQVSAIMQRYSQFFNHSVPLSAIAPTSNSSGSILWTLSPGNATLIDPFTFHAYAAPVTAYYEPHCNTSLKVVGTHSDELAEETIEQCSAIGAVNISFTDSTIPSSPIDATLRTGPYWTETSIRRSQAIDIAPSLAPNITTHYHSDTRAKAPNS